MASFQIQTFSGHSLDQLKGEKPANLEHKRLDFYDINFQGNDKEKVFKGFLTFKYFANTCVKYFDKKIALIFAPSFLKILTGEQVLEVTFEKVLICDIGSAVRPSEYKTLRYRE